MADMLTAGMVHFLYSTRLGVVVLVALLVSRGAATDILPNVPATLRSTWFTPARARTPPSLEIARAIQSIKIFQSRKRKKGAVVETDTPM